MKGLSRDQIMLWAAFLTCFYGFMRSGELCGQELEDSQGQTADLNYEDVAVDDISNPKRVQLLLRKSKTDIFWQGTHWSHRRWIVSRSGTIISDFGPFLIIAFLEYITF